MADSEIREEVAAVIEQALEGTPRAHIKDNSRLAADALIDAGLIQPLPASFTVEKLHKVGRIIAAADWGGEEEYAVRRALLADVRSWADALGAVRVPVGPKVRAGLSDQEETL